MALANSSMQRRESRMPHTGLRSAWLVALALSVLVHLWALDVLNQNFDFKFNQRSGAAALSTRLIVSPGESISFAAPQVFKAAEQANSMQTQAVSPAPSDAKAVMSQTSVEQAQLPAFKPGVPLSDSVSKPYQANPEETEFLKPNQPLAGIKTAPSAINSVVVETPVGGPSAEAALSTASPSAALRLQFPRTADLDYELVRVQRGQSQAGGSLLRWKSDGDVYELSLEATLVGQVWRSQRSAGSFDAMGLAPVRYSEKKREPQRAGHPFCSSHWRGTVQ
ncbi:MAG: hypothetical protein HC858_02470 [Brachymonas sp.]|nr:hypothetical protein [Brachymonas sp.]